MLFLLVVTMTAGWQKIFQADAGGFMPAIRGYQIQLASTTALAQARGLHTRIVNNGVDIAVTAAFMALVCAIVLANLRLWFGLLSGRSEHRLCEDPPTPLTEEQWLDT